MRGVLIMFGTPVAGRERLALEEFASYSNWATGLKSQGKIARYEVYAPYFGNLDAFSGFSVIEGADQQINAIVDSDDFRARVQRVMAVAKGVRVELVAVGEDMLKLMKLYGAQLQQLKI